MLIEFENIQTLSPVRVAADPDRSIVHQENSTDSSCCDINDSGIVYTVNRIDLVSFNNAQRS